MGLRFNAEWADSIQLVDDAGATEKFKDTQFLDTVVTDSTKTVAVHEDYSLPILL